MGKGRAGGKLNVSFVNTDASYRVWLDGCSSESTETCAEEWDNRVWEGSFCDGWAGGAKEESMNSGSRKSSRFDILHGSEDVRRMDGLCRPKMTGRDETQDGPTKEAGWEKIDLFRKSLQSTSGAKSILRKTNTADWDSKNSSDPTASDGAVMSILRKTTTAGSLGKRTTLIKWNDPKEWRFERNAPATEFPVETSSQDYLMNNVHEARENALANSSEVIELRNVFQSHDLASIVDYFNKEGTNRFSQDILDETCLHMAKHTARDIFKHNLLKLFINGAALGGQAASLHEWMQLEFTLERIDQVRADDAALFPRDNLSLVVLKVEPSAKEADEDPLLSLSIKPSVSESGFLLPQLENTGLCTFNPSLTAERSIEFQVRSKNTTIGTAQLKLNMVATTCRSWNDEHFSVGVEFTAPSQMTAQIHIRAKRVASVDRKIIEKKRVRGKEILQKSIETLLKKSINYDSLTPATLSHDAVCGSGLNLLQMAVNFESKGAVENLLYLGADATPGIKLVMSLREKVNKVMESPGTGSDNQAERLRRLDEISEILHKSQLKASLKPVRSNPTAATPTSVLASPVRSYPTAATPAFVKASLTKPPNPSLPKLCSDWLHQDISRKNKCRCAENGEYCTYGRGCTYVHVQRPWGSEFDDNYNKVPREKRALPISSSAFLAHMTVECHRGSDGAFWFTAGYKRAIGKAATDQRVVYAESSQAERNESGVCWFSSKKDAEEALRRSITLAFWADVGRGISSNLSHYGPQAGSTESPQASTKLAHHAPPSGSHGISASEQ